MSWEERYDEAIESGEIMPPNPCYGCMDYDKFNDKCLSNGGCGREE
jgi:hypothetical protein